MEVGDMVIRKVKDIPEWRYPTAVEQREIFGYGIILSKQMNGHPSHPCITVFYPKTGCIYDIAESLMELVAQGRRH